MKNIHVATFVFVFLVIPGCATLSKSECRTADWRTIGLEDGSKGRLANYIGNHRKACAEHGVTPDLAQYQLGHAEGLNHFCTAQKGFQQGNSGYGYNGVCPDGLRSEFLAGYESGRELFLLRKDIGLIQKEVESAALKLKELVREIASVEALLVSSDGTAAQRQAWIRDLKSLQYERGQLEGVAHDLELEVARKQGEYDVLSSQYRY